MTRGTFDLITIAIAIYGAVLGTLSLILSIVLAVIEFNRRRPKVKVTAMYGQLINDDGKTSEPLIIIDAVNVGNGSIVLTAVGWLLAGGNKQQIIKPFMLNLPMKLEERRKCITYRACRWFREDDDNKQIVAFYFQDETGVLWKSKITQKQRKLWLNAKNDGWQIMWNPKHGSYYQSDANGVSPQA